MRKQYIGDFQLKSSRSSNLRLPQKAKKVKNQILKIPQQAIALVRSSMDSDNSQSLKLHWNNIRNEGNVFIFRWRSIGVRKNKSKWTQWKKKQETLSEISVRPFSQVKLCSDSQWNKQIKMQRLQSIFVSMNENRWLLIGLFLFQSVAASLFALYVLTHIFIEMPMQKREKMHMHFLSFIHFSSLSLNVH